MSNLPLKNKLLSRMILYSLIVFFVLVGIYIYGYAGAFTYSREFIKDGEIASWSDADFFDIFIIPDKEKEFLEKNRDYYRRVSKNFIPVANAYYWFNWPYKFTKYTGLISYPEVDFSRDDVHRNYISHQRKSINTIVWGNIILFLLLFLISIRILRNIILLKRYLPCPVCDKSIKLITNWTCDYCHNKQGTPTSVFYKCNQCKRHLKTIYCEFCEKEVVL